MPPIHINRDRKSLGVFEIDAIQRGLKNGDFVGTDLVWRDGMTEWKPLSKMIVEWELDMEQPVLLNKNNEEISEAVNSPDPLPSVQEVPAWERNQELGIFTSAVETVQSFLFDPYATFPVMKIKGGLLKPCLFFLFTNTLVIILSSLSELTNFFIKPLLPLSPVSNLSLPVFLVTALGFILVSPALHIVSVFLSSSMTHLFIKMFRGSTQPFETTFRVICYAQGSTAILSLLPIFGAIITMIWGGYIMFIGLKITHKIGTLKSLLVITLPSIFIVLFFIGVSLILYSLGINILSDINIISNNQWLWHK